MPSCAPAIEYAAIPEGSSSAAPVINAWPDEAKDPHDHVCGRFLGFKGGHASRHITLQASRRPNRVNEVDVGEPARGCVSRPLSEYSNRDRFRSLSPAVALTGILCATFLMIAPRILFFGYSEVGHDCPFAAPREGAATMSSRYITHEDNPNENIWFKTPALAAREKGIPRPHAREGGDGRSGWGR